MVLFVASLLSAPWPSATLPALVVSICGLAGVLNTLIVGWRQRHVGHYTDYTPATADWLWYVAAPLIAYAVLVVAALLLMGSPVVALFALAGVMVVLLFLGIRNAWDLVTYIVAEHPARQDEQSERSVGTDQST